MLNEKHLPYLKFCASELSISPFGIEWMRFEKDSPIDKLIQTVPHIAFEVNDLDFELKTRDLKIIAEPNPPSAGVIVAMIEHIGTPIELIEFEKSRQ